ncbi:MAG: hypothetical protein JSR95_04280 [Proteobacteria bacterium]|nr:hypothetical protein [Pseudomonadota bacterium]
MAGRFEHLFTRNMKIVNDDLDNEGPAIGEVRPANIGDPFGLLRAVDIPGATVHMAYSWIGPTDKRIHWVNEHVHDYDEVLVWLGSDPANPHDLGGEISIDIGGENYRVTTTGSLYIPAGIRHCPLDFMRVERPFQFFALSLNKVYGSVR